jgi:hypothetical protein
MKIYKLSLVLLALLAGSQTLLAEEESIAQVEVKEGYASDTEALAKAVQNPVASMISLPFQNNINPGIGPNDETQNILNIQPVWPFELNDDWNLITRTIVPVISQPDFLSPSGIGRINGLGDTTFTAFVSPADAGDIIWGVGPVFLLPTGKDELTADKWGAGLSAVVLTMPGRWVIGSLVNNIWSFAGDGPNDVNSFMWQYFINYNFDGGWYFTSAPIITANWEEDNDHRWTVPFGGGFGKVFKIGNQPMNAQLSAYKNVITPDDYGADWQFRVQLQFLFPKK